MRRHVFNKLLSLDFNEEQMFFGGMSAVEKKLLYLWESRVWEIDADAVWEMH